MSSLRSTLKQASEDILRELQPNIWDTRGIDALRIYIQRWDLSEKMAEESLTADEVWKEAILDEALVNSARYKAYVKTGGMYKPTESFTEAEARGQSEQGAPEFVLSGDVIGDEINLITVVGNIHTTTEKILSYTRFQQDVLRDTLTLYPPEWRKKHLSAVSVWLTKLVKYEKPADDETLPRNVLKDILDNYLLEAREKLPEYNLLKGRPAKIDGNYCFRLQPFYEWVKASDRGRHWTRSEVKSFLKNIYGTRINFNARSRDLRYVEIRPEESEATETEILDDSGSGEDHPTP